MNRDPMDTHSSEGSDAGSDSDGGELTPCERWLRSRVVAILGIDKKKWARMTEVAGSPSKRAIINFQVEPSVRNILFYLNDAKQVEASISFPKELMYKSVYFIKDDSFKGELEEDIDSVVYYGELGPSPLNQLALMMDELYTPLLKNKKNHEGWPQVVAQDVLRHFHKVAGSVYVIGGLIHGKTLLPLPPDAEEGDESAQDKSLVHQLESAVIEWTHQVRAVIKSSSADIRAGSEREAPSPLDELDFWAAKADNLQCIRDQLETEKVRKIGRVLDVTDSSYFPVFQSLHDDVDAALTEALDINRCLSPLRRYFEDIENCSESSELVTIFKPLVHVIKLVWLESDYYTVSHLVVLIQEIGHQLIAHIREHEVESSGLFSLEPPSAVSSLEIALYVLNKFKTTFFEYKNSLASENPERAWRFDNSIVFADLDAFIARLNDLLSLMKTIVEFAKLERVEIGGSKGKILTAQVTAISEEFQEAVDLFQNLDYDVLDVRDAGYARDAAKFRATIADLERRISTVISDGFDDAVCLTSAFKLLDSFQGMLHRDAINRDFEEKYSLLLQQYSDDLDEVYAIFRSEGEDPPIHANLPAVAGSLNWSRSLLLRISEPHDKLASYGTLDSPAGVEVTHKYEQLKAAIEAYEVGNHSEWGGSVDTTSALKLQLPLLSRDEDTGLLSVNFDSELVVLLREVKYLEQLGLDIPPKAASIYAEGEQYRHYISCLEHAVNLYNHIQNTLIDVERPLVADRIDLIDREVEEGLTTLNWESNRVGSFIDEMTTLVTDVNRILTTLKSNVGEIERMMRSWSTRPLVERKDKRRNLVIEDAIIVLNQRKLEIELQGATIHKLLRESREVIEVEDGSTAWVDYVDYVNGIVATGFYETVKHSLEYIDRNMDAAYLAKNELPAFFHVNLVLDMQAKEAHFDPPLVPSDRPDLKTIYVDLMSSIIDIGRLVRRLDAGGGKQTYYTELSENHDIQRLRDDIIEMIDATIQDCMHYKGVFLAYQDLWTTPREEYMESFLLYGKVLRMDQDEILDEELEESPPNLEDFRHEIDQQIKYIESVAAIDDMTPFHWLRVDARPFKRSLSAVIQKWKFMFTQHLYDSVTSSVDELGKFIEAAHEGLSVKVAEGDYTTLVNLMSLLRDIRDWAENSEFKPVEPGSSRLELNLQPLHAKVHLLKEYGIETDPEVINELNDLPQGWNNLIRQMYVVKDTLTPLQQAEIAKIKERRRLFVADVRRFRDGFLAAGPFTFDFDTETVYSLVDEWHARTTEMEQHALDLDEQETLFELSAEKYREITDTRKDLRMLKGLWDLVSLVRYQFDEWKKSPWKEIQDEVIDDELKSFNKQIKQLPRECRAWPVFSSLDTYVLNLIKSLGSVQKLRSQSMRDRHWSALMTATGVHFDISGDVVLEDLLALKLHLYDDKVRGIVEQADRELSMERQLKDVSAYWDGLEFTFTEFKGVPQLKPDEDLTAALEENMVLLQNLAGAKYADHFMKTITTWQSKLQTVDSVMRLWLEVQHDWQHLEAIFLDSKDLQEQLPEDARRFAAVNDKWIKLMNDSSATPIALDVTHTPGLYKTLELLEGDLALCSKALDKYLETKRLAFPRFYFISNDDLLDILSHGTHPPDVVDHLFKLFDNLSSLEFAPANNDGTITRALTMFSAEGERVDFSRACDVSGQVEVWLNNLVDTMRKTLREILAEAVETYEEKSRTEWLFDYQAQICLAGVQIMWTSEVMQAFDRLVEGYENALKLYNKKQIDQLMDLITLLRGDLDKNSRRKIMTVCTIDTHNRDIIRNLIDEKVEDVECFGWQSQLRMRWDDEKGDCFLNICDAEFQYQYEYLGNTSRLVITPLTDRCYITLTQSLRLMMGGAPAGPAGTGKTETTKDLGRAMGIRVLVQNCSPQQTYLDMGNIFKGLAQSGMWGCFDEFNRIMVDVLSVVATQVKSILDAIRYKKSNFTFMGEEIELVSTVGMFITMNPGYAGRTELPDNLKALFRPVSMVVPDFDRICEIMLLGEGFKEAEELANKFITLYGLTKELLSDQKHYDWGLRAIKSVLVVAGELRRDEPDIGEMPILMRALRDFNLPKIVTEDTDVFLNLINDLFPKVDLDRKVNKRLEDCVAEAAIAAKLQPDETFILKVVQLEEIIHVRHSVFIIGPSGSGKTQVWKMLAKALEIRDGRPTIVRDLNPKAVDTKQLFGYKNPVTKEPMDGLFSCIMRDLSAMKTDEPKWIVLDGDIDPDWIESLNTVMDDNKVLTLPSNERIQLTPSMELVFEIGDVKHATPATVSRAGVLYVNEDDLGWGPYHTSWIDGRENMAEKSNLTVLFDRYVQPCLDHINGLKTVTHISDFQRVQTLCRMLDGLLTPENVPQGSERDVYETYFVFAVVWALGGSLVDDSLYPHRREFSDWFRREFKSARGSASVFDQFVDPETHKWVPWADRMPEYHHDPELPLSHALIHTPETVRTKFWVDLFIDTGMPVMLVGGAGVGKTQLIQDALHSLGDDFMNVGVNLNYYTDSQMLQDILEHTYELEKVGNYYVPPGNKKIVYFIDDLTMPQLDEYETQTPHTLLRQHIDYGHWYERQKWTVKNIKRCQYVAAMNPTTGSFSVNPRLSRHFAVFGVSFPDRKSLHTIYESILSAHLEAFPTHVAKHSERVVTAAIELFGKVEKNFQPTAVNFQYQFNLRSLSSVFQGLLNSQPGVVKDAAELWTMWIHESRRVFEDMLGTFEEIKMCDGFIREAARKAVSGEDIDVDQLFVEPLLYAHFAQGAGDMTYARVESYDSLANILYESLDGYNDLNAPMDLVLFKDAMEHVTRISRIIMAPSGNAILVGVGGSGKQSLARLAAHINTYEVFQIQIRSNYGVPELKNDLIKMYKKAGLKGSDVVFLFTDAQVVDEAFLIYINDLLASGNIPNLFPPEEVDEITNSLRNAVKQAGLRDTNAIVWEFFINRVRTHLHVVLCFSPVGDTLRSRYRKFPALINCTNMDWFHPWPEDALLSVANYFLQDVDLGEYADRVVGFIAAAHESVGMASERYRQQYRRYNYTTPKSFLELIKLYKTMLTSKRKENTDEIDRLLLGLERLQSAAGQVAKLHEELAVQQVDLEERTRVAEELVKQLGKDQEKVRKEREVADEEERKTQIVKEEVAARKADCDKDLEAAEPMLIKAEEALNTFDRNDLVQLRSYAQPPNAIKTLIAAVMVLQAPEGRPKRDLSWRAAKQYMADLNRFYESLVTFDRDNIPKENLRLLQPYLNDPEFNYESMNNKSNAAGGICVWIINIVEYNKVYQIVAPKRELVAEATANLEAAEAKLEAVKQKLAHLDANLQKLTEQFEEKNAEKLEMEAKAEATRNTIDLANRLVNGLESERLRWGEDVEMLKEKSTLIIGDVLVAAGFISYIGAFNRTVRREVLHDEWLPWIKKNEILISENYDPLSLLTNDATIALWNNDGLPRDDVSLENASIVTSCQRWPLLVDPQLQGVSWLKARSDFGDRLKVVRTDQKNYLNQLKLAIESGDPVIIEGIEENIDPILDPLIARELVKKGTAILLGDAEVPYHPNFKLFLQTKLGNPHFKPEIQAQTTLINFTVTEDGLEDQLLAMVVEHERPELEEQRTTLIRTLNRYQIQLKELESDLLQRLKDAEGDFLSNTTLVENLEETKKTSDDIKIKKDAAIVTQETLTQTRDKYRPVAARAALLYFLLNDLCAIDHMYQFSLQAFVTVFVRAIKDCPHREGGEDEFGEPLPPETVEERAAALVDAITFAVYKYTVRGLFARHKLIFTVMLCFRVMVHDGEMDPAELDYLLRGPVVETSVSSGVDWLSATDWKPVLALSRLETFDKLADDIEGSSTRWKKWWDEATPELMPMPQDWKNKTPFQKLCIVRALRPDRLVHALTDFIENCEFLGPKYTQAVPFIIQETFEETSAATPMFFILSPGVDPVKQVEAFARTRGFTAENGRFKNVSLGQGQEETAMSYLDAAYTDGAWVVLENIHLMERWVGELEKKLEELSSGAHEDFRVFLSAEPSTKIPLSILQNSIKVTNEPPAGMRDNMFRALANFNQEALEQCSKESEYHLILFTMCFFHATVLERRKFGPQGWNRPYNFNTGDLTISIDVLVNYLENNAKVPWEDLRYIFGEIMYGGHISDDWDRRLCGTYLEEFLRPELIDDQLELCSGFVPPPHGNYESYVQYVEDMMPQETPEMFGLPRNAEVGVLTQRSKTMFQTILSLQPQTTASGGAELRDAKIDGLIQQFLEPFNAEEELFNMATFYTDTADKRTDPYVVVALQECDRMNKLVHEIKTSLKDLQSGIRGDLMISEAMESLMDDLYTDRVPKSWADLAYPSLKPLGQWFVDLTKRIKQLDKWSNDFRRPNVVWLSGLFNPQSFLTAIMQFTARKNKLPLDKMRLQTEVTKKSVDDIYMAKSEGAYVTGLFLQGARWDMSTGQLGDAAAKSSVDPLPVVYLKAVTIDKVEREVYECPVYKTKQRGPTYVWAFNLRTRQPPSKWIRAGTAIVLSED